MNVQELIEVLDQRYGNPHAKECHLIQEGIKTLRKQLEDIAYWKDMFEKSMKTQEKSDL